MAKDPYKYFRVEARELTDQLGQGLLELERTGSGAEIVPRLLRLAHTLKGAARVVRQPEIAEHAHAIEGVLSPFREMAGSMPRESVDAVLKLIDAIAAGVMALRAPDGEGAAPAPAPGASDAPAASAPAASQAQSFEDTGHIIRTDVEEVDEILDGVTEAYTQIVSLREAAVFADRAHRQVDVLGEQLAATIRAGGQAGTALLERAVASVEQLRGLVGQLERTIAGTHERVDRELRQVRDAAEQLRLVPASAMFGTFERTARDAAHVLGKDVEFSATGGDVRLDAHVVRVVQDALIQLVRNGVAHGIEASDRRVAAGKPPVGRVEVSVARRGRRMVFACRDDGAGIDVTALRAAAIAKGGSAGELDNLDASGLVRALLAGGISTAAQVNDIAGRGIGMDIVRDALARLSGELSVATEVGKGTTLELIVPLSVSSVEALVVESAGVVATVPLAAVRHSLRLAPDDIHHSSASEAIVHEGHAVPLVSLGRLLGHTKAPARREGGVSALVLSGAAGTVAIAVDALRGTANTVFRTLPELAPASAAIAGASLDADGSPLLMLDPEGLVAIAMGVGDLVADREVAARPLLVIDDSLTTRMLEQSILESAGYRVDVATSAEEGLERVRRADYALILCDVEMPGMDGFAFIEAIRADARLRDIPAILVTSRNAPEDKQRGKDVGANGYVVKSEFDQGDLLEHIKELVA